MQNTSDEKILIADGESGIGGTYFFPGSNSNQAPFISGGVGISVWSAPAAHDTLNYTGPSFFFGGGYEFRKHYRIEANIMFNKPSGSNNGFDISKNSVSMMLNLVAVAY